MGAAEEGRLLMKCPSCLRPMFAATSNRVGKIIREKIGEYYNNHFKCRCMRQYALTPISNCCKVNYRHRSNIPFEVHELVYMGK